MDDENATQDVESLPSICVVVPTHDRPVEVREAIGTILGQDYGGRVKVLVVFDRAQPDESLVGTAERPISVMHNTRTPGLAGSRNTGILAADTDLVAFCDDDDYWEPDKLRRQVAALLAAPAAPLVTCSIQVEYEGRSTPRLAGVSRVTHAMLVRSRMSMLHSSTLLFRREPMLDQIGLVNEDIPGSQNEDWDLLLRASSVHPIVHVDAPLVHVRWGRASFFSRRWDTKIDSSIWMLEHHDDVRSDAKASARLMGQIAFAHACRGDRQAAWSWASRVARQDPRQWRWLLSTGVAVWPPAGERVLGLLHRFGRGV